MGTSVQVLALGAVSEIFEIEVEEFQFFSRIDRIVSWKPLIRAVARFDRGLLRMIPFLRPFARAIVVELRRPLAP